MSELLFGLGSIFIGSVLGGMLTLGFFERERRDQLLETFGRNLFSAKITESESLRSNSRGGFVWLPFDAL